MTPEQKEKFRIFLYDETTASFDNRDDVGKIIKWVEDNIEKNSDDWHRQDWIKFIMWYSGMFEKSVEQGILQYTRKNK